MVWPDGHGMLYGMTWRACHGSWYGLAGMAWYILRPGGHEGYMVPPSGHGTGYGLVHMVWYMVWLCRHCMVHGRV